MYTSAATVTVVCAFTYTQLAATISAWLPDAQAWIEGSTNTCRSRSSEIRSRAWAKAALASPSTRPRTSR